MSKAPGSVNDYDGSGDWFKIFDWGPTFSGGSSSWPMRSASNPFSFPQSKPNTPNPSSRDKLPNTPQ